MHRRLEELAQSPIGGARIWMTSLETIAGDELAELHASLHPTERARAARFHFEKDQQRFIAARGLLRVILGEELARNPAALVFEMGEHGKPLLADAAEIEPALHFNVSHSAGWGMFAVARGRRVGIDLEAAEKLGADAENLPALAARILSVRELEIWRALPDRAAQRAAFLRAWTRKEAYSKAIGQGFSADFARIELALDAAEPLRATSFHALSPNDSLTSIWLIRDLAAPAGFTAALALELEVENPSPVSRDA